MFWFYSWLTWVSFRRPFSFWNLTYHCKNFYLKHFPSSFFWALLCLIISAVLLTLPGSVLPKEDWLDKIWLDKWIHILLFFVLVIAWCQFGLEKVLQRSSYGQKNNLRKKLFLWIAIIALLYGIGMEFVQKYFIKNRSFDIVDVVADGVGCGIGLIYSLRRYIKK